MISTVEYLFAASLAHPQAGWRPCGRAAWHKPDGTVVHFLCFEEQLAIVGPGATMHVVGKASPELRRFKHKMVKLAA